MKTRSTNYDAILAALEAAFESDHADATDVLLQGIKAIKPSIGMLLEHSAYNTPDKELKELLLNVKMEFGEYILGGFRDDLIRTHLMSDMEGGAAAIAFIAALVGHLVGGAYHLGKCDGCPISILPGISHSDTLAVPPEVKAD